MKHLCMMMIWTVQKMYNSSYVHENAEQTALFQWAAYNMGRLPELRLMYHIPNGGSRNKAEAANLKRQGVKAGIPDIHLPVARGAYHSLYIEMKAGNNTTTEKQDEWLKELSRQGNAAVVCYGWKTASAVIEKYLGLGNCEELDLTDAVKPARKRKEEVRYSGNA